MPARYTIGLVECFNSLTYSYVFCVCYFVCLFLALAEFRTVWNKDILSDDDDDDDNDDDNDNSNNDKQNNLFSHYNFC